MQIKECFLFVNSGKSYRIIDFDKGLYNAILVDMYQDMAMPKQFDYEELKNMIEAEAVVQIADPTQKLIVEESLTEKEKIERNKYYDMIMPIWSNQRESLLDKRKRSEVFKKLSQDTDFEERKIKRLFSRFWQRGMNRNALLKDYRFCGNPGKTRLATPGKKKPGALRKLTLNGMAIKGISIGELEKTRICKAITDYYRKNTKPTYYATYLWMLEKYYNSCRIRNDMGNVIYDPEKVPSFNQFWYHAKKYRDIYLDITKRESVNYYNKICRPRFSGSYVGINGPGHRFQTDATIADVALVSALTGRPIGRPVVFGMVDVYSRLVTGIYVSLAPESWIGITMLLKNMVSDKVEFCKKIGIECTEYEWPSHHLPIEILGDNGPFVSKAADNLQNHFGVLIQNAASFRGDMKGIVERKFRTINDYSKAHLPGAILKNSSERGQKNPDDSAYLTLNDFVEIIVRLTIQRNNTVLLGHTMPLEMAAAGVRPIPVEMWDWGVKNLGIPNHTFDREYFDFAMLPNGQGIIKREGISFRKLNYVCDSFVNDHWEMKRLGQKVNMVYDPRTTAFAYMIEANGEIHNCTLTPKFINYGEYDWYDWEEKCSYENAVVAGATQEKHILINDMNREIEKIKKNSKMKHELRVGNSSNENKKYGKREDRKIERGIMEMAEAPHPFIPKRVALSTRPLIEEEMGVSLKKEDNYEERMSKGHSIFFGGDEDESSKLD